MLEHDESCRLIHSLPNSHTECRNIFQPQGDLTFDPGQIAKETNEVVFVQIYVQHHHTQIRSAGLVVISINPKSFVWET